MVEWFKNLFKGEDMLSSGCVSSGHKFANYGMCTICGEYK